MKEQFEPAVLMRNQAFENAGKEAERLLSDGVTKELQLRIDRGKLIAPLLEQKGFTVIEAILLREMRIGQLTGAVRKDDVESAGTAGLRLGLILGILEEIYLLPQLAKKADEALKQDADRRKGNEGRSKKGNRGGADTRLGRRDIT